MHPEIRTANHPVPDQSWRTTPYGLLRSLDVWAHCARLQLAGCEDPGGESHILRGID